MLKWLDVSEALDRSAAIQVTISGSAIKENAVAPLDGEQEFVEVNAPVETKFVVVNHGSEGIKSLDIDYSIVGGASGSQHIDLAKSVAGFFGEETEIALSLPAITEDGTYTLIPDANTFEGDLEEYLINNMTDQNLIAFAGVSSMEELEEYADSNEMSIDSLRELLIDSMVSSTVEAIAEDTDQGTYTISGDSISFDSSLMNDFVGTIGDGNMISFVNDYFSPANDYVLEFYPEG